MQHFCLKLVQYSKYIPIAAGTDGLVLQHQGSSSYSADYEPMHFQLFMG